MQTNDNINFVSVYSLASMPEGCHVCGHFAEEGFGHNRSGSISSSVPSFYELPGIITSFATFKITAVLASRYLSSKVNELCCPGPDL
jgi:hypothetical protein